MRIYDFSPVDPQMGSTRTYEHFFKYIGANPHRLGTVARLYEDYTALYMTEALANTFYNDVDKKLNKFQNVNNMMYEWNIETKFQKKIPFAERPTDIGNEGSEIVMAFAENYYQKYDIFVIDGSRQQCIVISRPVRKDDRYWEVTVRLIDTDFSSTLDLTACDKGCTTHWISNAHPELSEEGYTKRQSNIEKHRNFITTFRNDISESSLMAATEELFTTIEDNKSGNSQNPQQKNLKLSSAEKELFDSFMFARSTGLLLNKSNVDVNGRPTIQDPVTNRPLYIGDGMIPQIERYCPKHVYNRLSIGVMNTVIRSLTDRSDTTVGNTYIFATNNKLWSDVNTVLSDWLSKFNSSNPYMWSKAKNGYVEVGATYQAYEIGGNKIIFRPDSALTREYGDDKGYGFMIDITPNKNKGMAAINMFTLKNGEFINASILGVGGRNGVTSGLAATTVAGSTYVIMGYASVGVMNPYKSFILMES